MSDSLGATLRDELARLLAPLSTLGTPAGVRAMLASFGHVGDVAEHASLRTALAELASLVEEIQQIDANALDSFEGIARRLQVVGDIFAAIGAVEQAVTDPALAARTQDLGTQLVNRLIALYLRTYWPRLHAVFAALTLIAPAEQAASHPLVLDGDRIVRTPWVDDELRFDRLGDLIERPWPMLRDAYLPNGLAQAADAHEAAARLFPLLGSALSSLGFRWLQESRTIEPPPPPASGEPLIDGQDHPGGSDSVTSIPFVPVPPRDPAVTFRYRMPRLVVGLPGADGATRFGLAFTISSAKHDGGVAGIIVSFVGELAFDETRDEWQITATSEGTIPVFIVGPTGIDVAQTTAPDAGASGRIGVARVTGSGPALIVGSATGSRLELGRVRFGVDYTLTPERRAIGVTLDVEQAVLAIAPGDGDGLLARLLPSGGLRAEGNVGVALSSDRGFELGVGVQGAPLSGEWAIGRSFGAIRLDAITRRLEPIDDERGGGARVVVGVRATAQIGPATAVIDGIGIGFDVFWSLQDPARTPNLGVLHVDDLGFRPPLGVGLAVDAGVAAGGGFLKRDAASGRYEGVLELAFLEIGVAAFGLIETRLPDNRPGYSFVFVLSAQFSPGLQLAFGFRLDGVGGLLAANRTISLDAVRAALWSHQLDGLLFPADPIAAAPHILSTLGTCFPAADGRYVLGPIVKINWADLVDAVVGLFIELPAPTRVLLIGGISVGVPRGKPQLELHVDFAGGIDFGKKLAFFEATLRDSRIESYPIVGDLAFRYEWGQTRNFALAIGGFHPHFQPPAGFPPLKRVGITIGKSDAQLEARAYFALTSNTLQFGAHVELTAGSQSGFNLHGWLGFDALCSRAPLHFEFDLSAGVELRRRTSVLASVHLEGHVSGPNPWHVAGKASLSLLFFDVSVHFNKTWGDAAPALPPIDPLPELLAAFANPIAYSSVLPAAAAAVITTTLSSAPADEAVLLDPAGALQIEQRVVPLNQTITRFHDTPLAGPRTFSIAALSVSGHAIDEPASSTEEFALAQFDDLSDAEKLSLPSFVPLPSGVVVGSDAVDVGQSGRSRAVITPVVYATTIIDAPSRRMPGLAYTLAGPDLIAMNARTGAPTSSTSGAGRYAPAAGTVARVTLAPERFLIADVDAGQPQPAIVSDGTKRGALVALKRYVALHPDVAGTMQLLTDDEVGG
jgi:hypothetical protein